MVDTLQLWRQIHPRQTFNRIAGDVKRTFRVGDYWYWVELPELAEGIEIAKLVCPLRYDVIVRRDFYFLYHSHRELYRSDFDAFAHLVRQSTYYTWFSASEAVRCRPYLLDDHERLEAQFLRHMARAVALWESMETLGFDERFPVTLKTAEVLLPPTADRLAPPTGKFVSDRYFMADGCHRLAWLMFKGYTLLPAAWLRVKCFREFSPFDSTSLLAPSLPIGASEYFSFLSSRYCDPASFEDRESFLGHVSRHKPGLLEEVLSLIQVDGFETSDS